MSMHQGMNSKTYLVIILTALVMSSCISCSSGDSDEGAPNPDPDPPVQTDTTFKNPIRNTGPDPWVIKDRDEYFVTFTTGRNITLLRTKKMSELSKATSKVIWVPPASGFNAAEIWAPELHKIDNVWYVYYAASDGNNENHRMWVLQNTAADPFEDSWEDMGELELPDDKWAIDGTPFKVNDQYYFAWSGWEGDENIRQNIYISTMENPLKVGTERVCLLKPEDSWETNNTSPLVTEAPQFFMKDDKIFIFYSAGGCWKDGYSIGTIWMEATGDILNPDAWKRSEQNPLFVSNTSGNAFGPGHNSFFTSVNGEEHWILYHANANAGDGCGDKRSIRMQKISWDAAGFPVLGTPEALDKELEKPAGEE